MVGMQEVIPVKKKSTYKSVAVQRVDGTQLAARFSGQRCIVGIDVAKTDMFASFSTVADESKAIVRFQHPAETRLFVELCKQVRDGGAGVEVAMEATGTYGDALRAQLVASELPVFQVDARRSHDAAMVLDGVPSWHDRKSAVLIAWLHAHKISRAWRVATDGERAARAALARRDLYAGPLERNTNRLEALLAKHWPELLDHFTLASVSMLTLLSKYPTPALAHADRENAVRFLRTAGHGMFRVDKLTQAIASATTTLGEPTTKDEEVLLSVLVAQTLDLHRCVERVDAEITEIVRGDVVMQRLASPLGAVTAAAIVAHMGDPGSYASSQSFLKAIGLNLKERSSGKHQGKVMITKQGPTRVRFYLFFAALRFIITDRVVRAWYRKRKHYAEGHRMRGIIAVMRKLARALPYIARGETFDSAKLFDTRRLSLAETAASQGASPVAKEGATMLA